MVEGVKEKGMAHGGGGEEVGRMAVEEKAEEVKEQEEGWGQNDKLL